MFECLRAEMDLLSSCKTEHETTIVVAPHAFPLDFIAFNEFVQDVDDFLHEERLDEQFQLVGFHPHFRFAGEEPDDPGNYVNRSPIPAFHLLRQEDVTKAVDSSPTSLEVPVVNQERLRELGASRLRELLRDCEDDRPTAAA